MKRWQLELTSIAFFLLAWEAVALSGVFPRMLFPRLEEVFASLLDLAATGKLFVHIAASLKRVLAAFLLAAAIGIPWGMSMGANKSVLGFSDWYVRAMLSLGGISWIPLSILWFGLTEASRVFVILMGSLPPVVMNTMEGVRNINPNLVKAAKVLGSSNLKVFTSVVCPSILPSIVTGLKLSLGFGFRVMIAAELIAAPSGLGYLLESSRAIGDVPTVLTTMLVIVALVLLIEHLGFETLERRLFKWRPSLEP